MIIEVLKKEDTSLSAKDLTDKLVLEFPEKLEHKKGQFEGDEKRAIIQIKAEVSASAVSNDNLFFRDRSFEPLKIGLVEQEIQDEDMEIEVINEDFENKQGLVYILGTQVFTKDGKELVKIGLTTQKIQDRINTLYNTSTPFEFTVLREYKTSSYAELEKAMHKLLNKYRPNPAREFFVSDCLEFADEIYELHKKIEDN